MNGNLPCRNGREGGVSSPCPRLSGSFPSCLLLEARSFRYWASSQIAFAKFHVKLAFLHLFKSLRKLIYYLVKYWFRLSSANPLINLATDTESARTSSEAWIVMGGLATAFMAVTCYGGVSNKSLCFLFQARYFTDEEDVTCSWLSPSSFSFPEMKY